MLQFHVHGLRVAPPLVLIPAPLRADPRPRRRGSSRRTLAYAPGSSARGRRFATRRARVAYSSVDRTMSLSPGSMTVSMETLKYLPHAVPRSTFEPL